MNANNNLQSVLSREKFNLLLGNLLRNIRTELGLSQIEFASKAGLGRTYYGSIERGEKAISTYNLFLLLTTNNISISEFFEKI